MPPSRRFRLVPAASLFNHSCAPSAAKTHGTRFAIEVYALRARPPRRRGTAIACGCRVGAGRVTACAALPSAPRQDIAVGDEVTISYIPLSDALDERRAVLTRHFGFRCACARCTAEEAAGASSLSAGAAPPAFAHACGGARVPLLRDARLFCCACSAASARGAVALPATFSATLSGRSWCTVCRRLLVEGDER